MLTISEVPAAGVVDAGETLQLEEVFLLAAELAVATLLRACATRRLRLGLDIRQREQSYYIQTKVHTVQTTEDAEIPRKSNTLKKAVL